VTREQSREIASVDVDHAVLVLQQCVDELKTGYCELYRHEFVMGSERKLVDAHADLGNLITAIRQAQTAHKLTAAE
jgi:hypothetical protein